jgi:hypothetical protein
MSTDPSSMQQAKMREFMSILPLTLELAGLPRAEGGRYFTDGQMEVRVSAIRNAFKLSRQLLIEISKPSEG